MKKYILITLFIFSSIMPVLVMAQAKATPEPTKLDYSGLVKCDGILDPKEPFRNNPCNFVALMAMVKSTINWLFLITIPIMTVLLAYAGLLYMTGTQGNIGTAKSIFQSAGKGFIIMLIAWVSVITVVNWFITQKNQEVIKTFVNIK